MKDPTTSLGTGDQPAQLRYSHHDYEILAPGRYVICAVTGERIPLAHLRYWNAELQEAYASCEASLQRMTELKNRKRA
ncbi:MAG: DUF2093 domain-containing protein [Alphaproteobacteria bacterium]|nr:MAG: DUF2093 domain-containing protein [Alphaproteobacteria bacterium]